MAYDTNKMQDIKLSEKSLWLQYLSYMQNGDISEAIVFLNNHQELKYKVLNSFNWNRLINSINDATDTTSATYDSLVGEWNIDYAELVEASKDFKYIGTWASDVEYKKNNLVLYQNNTYYCLIDNINILPTTLSPNWIYAQNTLDSVGIQRSLLPPTNLRVGDIFLEDVIHF